MPMPSDQKVSQASPGEQKPDPSTQKSQGTGTSGGGSAPAAPQPTAEAPTPKAGTGGGSHDNEQADAGGSSGGISSSLQPGGMSPTNEGFAGMGRLNTPGASTGPGAGSSGDKKAGS